MELETRNANMSLWIMDLDDGKVTYAITDDDRDMPIAGLQYSPKESISIGFDAIKNGVIALFKSLSKRA